MRAVLLLLLTMVVAGCATTPPLTASDNMCDFRPKVLILDDPQWRGRPQPLDDDERGPPGPTLILSGGSQNGAFGAGFLKRWGELGPEGKLPRFDLVTGISTGAILSTWAFIREPEKIANAYLVDHEKRLLDVYTKPSKKGGLGLGQALALVRKNAFADLGPLRDRLTEIIGFDTLNKVANEPGRLVIASVDVDSGHALLFDMKKMAKRAVIDENGNPRAETSPEFLRYRACYVEAIMASSSVPLAAKPVFLDNRMMIDGGARFGMFVDYLDRASAALREGTAAPSPATGAVRPQAPNLYIIVNGTLWQKVQCGKVDETYCKDEKHILDPDPHTQTAGPHKKWQIASLALRSNDLLVNQVYRFSAARVKQQYDQVYPARDFDQHFYFTRMRRGELFEKDEDQFKLEGKSCVDWARADKQLYNPLEFYPNYMRCIQAYGAHKAEVLGWHNNAVESPYGANAD